MRIRAPFEAKNVNGQFGHETSRERNNGNFEAASEIVASHWRDLCMVKRRGLNSLD
jgi:hypothetical protein